MTFDSRQQKRVNLMLRSGAEKPGPPQFEIVFWDSHGPKEKPPAAKLIYGLMRPDQQPLEYDAEIEKSLRAALRHHFAFSNSLSGTHASAGISARQVGFLSKEMETVAVELGYNVVRAVPGIGPCFFGENTTCGYDAGAYDHLMRILQNMAFQVEARASYQRVGLSELNLEQVIYMLYQAVEESNAYARGVSRGRLFESDMDATLRIGADIRARIEAHSRAFILRRNEVRAYQTRRNMPLAHPLRMDVSGPGRGRLITLSKADADILYSLYPDQFTGPPFSVEVP